MSTYYGTGTEECAVGGVRKVLLGGEAGDASQRSGLGTDTARFRGRIEDSGSTTPTFQFCSRGKKILGSLALVGIMGINVQLWPQQVPLLLNSPLFPTGLAPLVAFNVDVAQTWVTPKGGRPYVLSCLLHQDPSTNQTW